MAEGKVGICQKCLACGKAQLFCSFSLSLKGGGIQKHPQAHLPFALLPCNSEADTVWVHDAAACSATGDLEMRFICSSTRLESEPSPLGSTMPRTWNAKVAPKQSCCLPFPLTLQGLFRVALPSHAEQSVGRALWGQVETFPEEWEIRNSIVVSFSLATDKPEQLWAWRGAPALLRVHMQGVWVVLWPQQLLYLALSFHVAVTAKSMELRLEKMTSEISGYGRSLCLAAHKYCM